MRLRTAFTAIMICCISTITYAMYSVHEQGAWPESWPEELEPIRAQSRTLVGGAIDRPIHELLFDDREDFEAAWPHILKVKSERAPLILLRAPSESLGTTVKAGVRIWCPPKMAKDVSMKETPIPGDRPVRSRWMRTRFIELIVDGDIVDLNRIPFPEDTPIVDERFVEYRAVAEERADTSQEPEPEDNEQTEASAHTPPAAATSTETP